MDSVIKYYRPFSFLLLLLCILPQLSAAKPMPGETDLTEIFARLQSAAAETRSLSSDFTQEKHLAIFTETLLSKGRFYYRTPDQLRWELLTPVRSGFVLRGQQGERWNNLSKEVSPFQINTDPIMGIIAQQLLAWARVDINWLKSRYRIKMLEEQPVRLQLFPLDQGEASFIAQLQILFASDNRHVRRVEMHEVGGDKTLLLFENTQLNQALPAQAFQTPEL